ncbi:MAG: rRNA maturation RNase YbeY [Candidatus Moraniibacteriota bacterium]|nr:MAG: rRNA maturation RNase YbeY [Candidatus Moranbacteria bacterium]
MRLRLEYVSEVATVPASLDQDFFERIATETLKRVPLDSLKDKESITLSAVLVSPERIQELNRTYRGKDKVTDILSFGDYTDIESLRRDGAKDIFLGELFFCYDFISQSATEDEVSVTHEMIYVFSHGILHLLGYDHCDEMFAIQDSVTATLVQK